MFLVLAIGLCAPALAGDVAFSSPAVIAASPAAASALVDLAPIASADLDQDGDRDVVAAFRVGALTIFAWLENAPAWLAHPLASLPGSATALCSGDLDGDGDQDIALTTRDPGIIAWLENDGAAAPGFTLHVVAASGSARSVSAADVNQDGKLDLLLVNNGNVLWLENDGGSPPSFIVRLISTGASCAEAVAAADLDGDGDLDAVSASPCDGKIRWHENDGAAAPAFVDHDLTSAAPGVLAIAVADLDRDGDRDVVAASPDASTIAWYENDGGAPPAFAVRTIGGADAAVAVAAVDLDHDARLDVLAWSLASPTIDWFENDGGAPPAFVPHAIALGGEVVSTALASDVNGDGELDLLARLGADQAVALLDNRTSHGSAIYPIEHVIDAAFDEADEGKAFDLDGDGDLDVIAVSRAGDTVAWWQNLDGSGGAWLKRVIDSAVVRASAVTAADLDGDGSLDVIGCSFNASDVYWWRNVDGQGTTWSRATIDAALGGAQSVAAADIDGDGDLDVVGNGENADDVTWYANQDGQGGAWQRTTIDASFDGANFVVTGDVDHDGDVDVASAARNGDEIAWWENLGGQGQSWTKHSVVTGFDLAAGTDLADVDGDGDLDVLGVAFNSNTIAWWENADAVGTTWTQHLVDTDFTFAIYVEGADVDRDGDIDLVGAAHNQGEISWFENLDGKGTQWLEHPVTVGFTIVTSSVARDIDGDGDLDVLGVAAVADAVEWWENRGGQVAFATTSTAPPSLTEGATDDVLKIVSSHRGRAGDGDLLLGSIDLLLEETPGTPLTSAQADAVFRKISIYLDDGSGAFEPALDRLVTSVSQFTLASGVLTVPLAAGAPAQSAVDSKVRIAATTSRSYFVVVELEGDAADHGIGSFAITHRPLSDRAFDLDFRLPLALEYALAVSSGVITIVNG